MSADFTLTARQSQRALHNSLAQPTMTLLQFLRQARQVHLQFLSGALSDPPIYVLGNPSADLDSIISAIVYSYCANHRLPTSSKTTPRPHVPLLNLPNVPAGAELYRLRPEFVTALWLSTCCPSLRADESFENASDSAGTLLREHIVTIADFAQSLKEQTVPNPLVADATLVDWNALQERTEAHPGQGSVSGLSGVSFCTVGCIDHHVDEHFVPRNDSLPGNQPLIIQPGPGSCASLVTNELHNRGLWAASSPAETAQVAKLALAAVLVDTSSLTAEGKVTGEDVSAVEFLRRQVEAVDPAWDMGSFYEQVLAAKKNSLDLLTLAEVLDRDYKDWTETTRSAGQSVKLGFCSSVKPIRWIVQKAGGTRQFLDGVRSFAASEGKELDIVVVMTSFTSGSGAFSRELFICVMGDGGQAVDGVAAFVDQAASQLNLAKWTPLDDESVNLPEEDVGSTLDGDVGLWRRLWMQENTKASRKQVAPLLRTAVSQL
ncbi:uncharacterized protein N7459_008212 [Penicillium hispanicum]|uniref:uncharacterized protein n=1 Tax=Penicillium hispanicum TaxID=1080232 RepID=UPI00253FB6A7|nr:uncharacterized protein N7459_008212 [Penicillium hispanicum]KAJ5573785.1 hypothetical protein N7459_008212 [Penicillium hispanicum]